MGSFEWCMKAVLAAVNFTTIILGLALAAAGVVIIVKGHVYFPEVPQYSASFHTPCGILIGLGVFMVLVGIFGCYSAFSGRSGFLNCYFYFIFSLALIEIAAAVYWFIKRDTLTNDVMGNVEQWFSNFNAMNATELQMLAVSTIQRTLDCCGLEGGPNYWTAWDEKDKVPASCCGSRSAKPTSGAYYCLRQGHELLQTDPCTAPLQKLVYEVLVWGVLGTLVGLIVLNTCVMFSAKFLRGSSSYRDSDFVYTRYNNHDTSSSFTGKTTATGVNSTWL